MASVNRTRVTIISLVMLLLMYVLLSSRCRRPSCKSALQILAAKKCHWLASWCLISPFDTLSRTLGGHLRRHCIYKKFTGEFMSKRTQGRARLVLCREVVPIHFLHFLFLARLNGYWICPLYRGCPLLSYRFYSIPGEMYLSMHII